MILPGTVLICEGIDQFGKELIDLYGKYWTVVEPSHEDLVSSGRVLTQSDKGFFNWILLEDEEHIKFEVL